MTISAPAHLHLHMCIWTFAIAKLHLHVNTHNMAITKIKKMINGSTHPLMPSAASKWYFFAFKMVMEWDGMVWNVMVWDAIS